MRVINGVVIFIPLTCYDLHLHEFCIIFVCKKLSSADDIRCETCVHCTRFYVFKMTFLIFACGHILINHLIILKRHFWLMNINYYGEAVNSGALFKDGFCFKIFFFYLFFGICIEVKNITLGISFHAN